MILLNKVLNFINKYNMICGGDTVVCGLSGGADSVALLLIMKELSERLNITVEALHVNHCLRGKESDRDELFCKALCSENHIPFTAASCDVMSYSRSKCLSVEEAARELRYLIFKEKTAEKKMATAHNANDALETAVLNLARGTGIKGLAGVPPVRGNIIRPLLAVTRTEIEAYLESKGQAYVTDSTNLSDDYTRNKIRHKIIPLLQEINSSVIDSSVRSLDVVRDENSLIEKMVDEAVMKCLNGTKFTGLDKYDPVIRKRAISRLLSDNKLPYSHNRLDEADNILINGGKINISDNFYLIGANNTLELKKIMPVSTEIVSVPLQMGINQIFEECTLFCELVECDNLKKNESVNKISTFFLLDYDKIRGRAIVRSRVYGDKIKLCGRSFTSSVKKLINEMIAADKRSTLHFIEDEEGTIFAEGIGIADRVAPDKDTARLLKISVNRI